MLSTLSFKKNRKLTFWVVRNVKNYVQFCLKSVALLNVGAIFVV